MNAASKAPDLHEQIKAGRLELHRLSHAASEKNHEVGRLLYQLRRSYSPLRSRIAQKMNDRLFRAAARLEHAGRLRATVTIDPERDHIRLDVAGYARAPGEAKPRQIIRHEHAFDLSWGWPAAECGTSAEMRKRLDGYRDIAAAALAAALKARKVAHAR